MEHLQAPASPADSEVGCGKRVDSSSATKQLPAAKPSRIVRFANVVVLPRARRLLVEGAAVALGSRAFEILLALIESPGEILSKTEIMSRVWPTTCVEECNLRFQISELRRALGSSRDLVRTIPGRGYVFVGESEEAELTVCPENDTAPDTAPTVVLIDNDPESALVVSRLLRALKVHLRHYGSVEEFRSASQMNGIACIVLDVWLPGRNGFDLLAEIEESGTHIPLIFVSSADVPTAVRAMKGGATDFLQKPIRQLDLVDALRPAIANGKRPPSSFALEDFEPEFQCERRSAGVGG